MSLKQFKDTITMDVETIFETIRIGLTSLNAKVEEMESKVSSIEKHVRSTLQLPARTMHKERS